MAGHAAGLDDPPADGRIGEGAVRRALPLLAALALGLAACRAGLPPPPDPGRRESPAGAGPVYWDPARDELIDPFSGYPTRGMP